VRSGTISAQRGAEALKDLVDLPITRYPHSPFLADIWQIQGAVTAYDAAYLVLADILNAALITRDRALAKASSRVQVI
jgi:predicted nucleic acid-binding protein